VFVRPELIKHFKFPLLLLLSYHQLKPLDDPLPHTHTTLTTPYHLVGALLGGLLQFLESGDPASLLCLILCEDEDLALQPHAALLVAGDAEDGRDELGPGMDDVVGGHLTHFKTLVPRATPAIVG